MEKLAEFEFLIVNGQSEIVNFIESLNKKDREKRYYSRPKCLGCTKARYAVES